MFTPTNELSQAKLDHLVENFDHHSFDYRSHSIDILMHMQNKTPFAHAPSWGGFWVATKAEDCLEVAKNVDAFSNWPAEVIPALEPTLMIPINVDPPLLYDYRAILNPLFAPNKVKAHAAYVRQLAEEMMGKLVANGGGDLKWDYALPLTGKVTLKVAGLKDDDWQIFGPPLHDLVYSRKPMDERLKAMAGMIEYMRSEIRRLKDDPVPGSVIEYLHDVDMAGRKLRLDEIASIIDTRVQGLENVVGDKGERLVASLEKHTESFANRHHVGKGELLTLQTPSGPQPLLVQGVYFDYSSDLGYISLPRPWYQKFYGEDKVSSLALFLKPGANGEAVRQKLLDAIAASGETGSRMIIRNNAELRAEVLRIFDRTFAITYALHIIAIAVALLTVMNSLFALVLEARRDFGILKYLGASNEQVRRIVLTQAGLLGFFGNLFGLAVGLILSQLLIHVINLQSFGWTIQFAMPWGFLLQSFLLVMGTALLAGLIPARWAARTPAPEVIRSE